MVAASRALPPEAARINATPQASDTKNAYSCETPRSLGFAGVVIRSVPGSETVFIPRRYRHRGPLSRGGIWYRWPALGAIHAAVQAGHRVGDSGSQSGHHPIGRGHGAGDRTRELRLRA